MKNSVFVRGKGFISSIDLIVLFLLKCFENFSKYY